MKQEGVAVRLTARSDAQLPDVLYTILTPPLLSAREAARRAQGASNLKQIALAMHNYADANGHFPPAVLLGPDGMTPYSWRVALLPYLEQQALYERYNFNEPWDGPNNRKLMEIAVPSYHSPQDPGPPTNSSYFVLTGPPTMFNGHTVIDFSKITDGLSTTILVVEAKRDIPWTKPEDIAIDAQGPLPSLANLQEGGLQAAFADGAVRFLSTTIDQYLLRAMITPSGGEAIPLPGGDATPATGAPPPGNLTPPALPRVPF